MFQSMTDNPVACSLKKLPGILSDHPQKYMGEPQIRVLEAIIINTFSLDFMRINIL